MSPHFSNRIFQPPVFLHFYAAALTCEPVEQKAIGKRSQIVYLAVNFERGVVFAKFLLYRTDKNWVVQNLYFDTRPEAIMPWLATEGTKNAE